MCLRPSDSSALELFRTKCKLLEYSLMGWLPVHLLISSSTCFASVITPPLPLWPLPFIPSTADLYHSFISASHNLDCFLLLSLSRFTIVFQFGMAPLLSLCSELLRWSPKKFQADLPPHNSFIPSFSSGLSQGQEFRVVCLPRIEQKTSDRQLWGAIVGSGVPTGSGDLLTLVDAYELLWSRSSSEVHASITYEENSFCYATQQIILTNFDGFPIDRIEKAQFAENYAHDVHHSESTCKHLHV